MSSDLPRASIGQREEQDGSCGQVRRTPVTPVGVSVGDVAGWARLLTMWATVFYEILIKDSSLDFINIIIAEFVALPRKTLINFPESFLMATFDATEHYWFSYMRSVVV